MTADATTMTALSSASPGEINKRIAVMMGWERVQADPSSRKFALEAGAFDESRGQFLVRGDAVLRRIRENTWDFWDPCSDPSSAASVEAELERRGLGNEYVHALQSLLGQFSSPSSTLYKSDAFAAMRAPLRTKMEAALAVVDADRTLT